MENTYSDEFMKQFNDKCDSIINLLESLSMELSGVEERIEERVTLAYQDFLEHSQEEA